MNFDCLSPARRASARAVLSLLLLAPSTGALAQSLPPAPAASASLPGASALQNLPTDNRLPGPDPRRCGPTKYSALCAEGRWADFALMRVEMKAPGFVGVYNMDRPENLDVHTTYSETRGKARRGGEVVFVNEDSFAYRSRDKFASDETLLDELMSSPILVTQLAALLLDQGALVGPAEITKPLEFSARSTTQYLRTEAPGMAALFGPPWELTGTVRPDERGALAFRLRLSHRPVDSRGRLQAGKRDVVNLVGTVDYGNRRKAMPDTFDLVGWKLVNRSNTIDPVKTMDEARQAVGGR